MVNILGWIDGNDKTSYEKLIEKVEYFSAFENYNRIAITTDNKIVAWGNGVSGGLGVGAGNVNVPTEYNLPSSIGNYQNIKEFVVDCSFHAHFVTLDGKLIRTGSNSSYAYYGEPNNSRAGGSNTFQEWNSTAINLNTDETIVKFLDRQSTAILLTSDGRMFGYGDSTYLGTPDEVGSLTPTRELTGITDVEQVVMGNGWVVVVKEDGTVWGTGNNTYGVLGRWKGIGRGESNSRYKTALNWVECPDLEF